MSPAGTTERGGGKIPPQTNLGDDVLVGRVEATQDSRPGTFSVVPCGTSHTFYLNPGLTSWATLSRPYGTSMISCFAYRTGPGFFAVTQGANLLANNRNFGSDAPAHDWGDQAQLVHKFLELIRK
jgi:hypothetical protein